MKSRPNTLELLAQALAEKVKRETNTRSVASRPEPWVPGAIHFDAITRDAMLRRVRFLARSYRLQWLVEQQTFGRTGADELEFSELCDLLRDMEHARECIEDGISFEEAGLVKSTYIRLFT